MSRNIDLLTKIEATQQVDWKKMKKEAHSDRDLIARYLRAVMQEGKSYKLGMLYDDFVEQTGGARFHGEMISFGFFAKYFSRDVLSRDGFLARTSSGIYALRKKSGDGGVTYTKKRRPNRKIVAEELLLGRQLDLKRAMQEDVTWESVLDNTVELYADIMLMLEQMKLVSGVTKEMRKGFRSISIRIFTHMDELLTDISGAMAFLEDNLEMQAEQESGMEMSVEEEQEIGEELNMAGPM